MPTWVETSALSLGMQASIILVMKGRAKEPVYLFVSDGKVGIRKANQLWGLDTYETQKTLKEEFGDERVESMVIGRSWREQSPT